MLIARHLGRHTTRLHRKPNQAHRKQLRSILLRRPNRHWRDQINPRRRSRRRFVYTHYSIPTHLFSSPNIPPRPPNTIQLTRAHPSKVWDTLPPDPLTHRPNYVELKTTATPTTPSSHKNFERKLLKFWAQSFLLGVPKLIVGFRSAGGVLQSVQEFETTRIPKMVRERGAAAGGGCPWESGVCINFGGAVLGCEFFFRDFFFLGE